MLLFLLQAQATPSISSFPSGWAIIGWVAAALIALIYLYSGVLQNVNSGRKDLIEVGEKKLASTIKEKEELEFKLKQIEEKAATLEKQNLEMEKEKIMVMREHHQLLEISVADLNTLKANIKIIEQLQEEVNRYREEKGLPPKTYISDTK